MRNLDKKTFIYCLTIFQLLNNIYTLKEWWENSSAIDLTTENFFEVVGKDKYVVVKFYTRWCGYCRIMAPEYEKLVEVMKENREDVVVARLEGSINEDISVIYEIFSFPKIVLFYPGSVDVRSNFRGQRLATVMQAWINKNAPKIEKNLKYLAEDNSITQTNEKAEIKIKDANLNNKTKTFNLEEAVDSTKNFTSDIDFMKVELLNMKNRVINLEKDIEELKNNTINIINSNNNKNTQQNINSNFTNLDIQDEIAKKLKMAKEKKKLGEGFFDKFSMFDIFIYVGIILFVFGAVITIKKIMFRKDKNITSQEHVKV